MGLFDDNKTNFCEDCGSTVSGDQHIMRDTACRCKDCRKIAVDRVQAVIAKSAEKATARKKAEAAADAAWTIESTTY